LGRRDADFAKVLAFPRESSTMLARGSGENTKPPSSVLSPQRAALTWAAKPKVSQSWNPKISYCKILPSLEPDRAGYSAGSAFTSQYAAKLEKVPRYFSLDVGEFASLAMICYYTFRYHHMNIVFLSCLS
jgi:hypothetical protein